MKYPEIYFSTKNLGCNDPIYLAFLKISSKICNQTIKSILDKIYNNLNSLSKENNNDYEEDLKNNIKEYFNELANVIFIEQIQRSKDDYFKNNQSTIWSVLNDQSIEVELILKLESNDLKIKLKYPKIFFLLKEDDFSLLLKEEKKEGEKESEKEGGKESEKEGEKAEENDKKESITKKYLIEKLFRTQFLNSTPNLCLPVDLINSMLTLNYKIIENCRGILKGPQ